MVHDAEIEKLSYLCLYRPPLLCRIILHLTLHLISFIKDIYSLLAHGHIDAIKQRLIYSQFLLPQLARMLTMQSLSSFTLGEISNRAHAWAEQQSLLIAAHFLRGASRVLRQPAPARHGMQIYENDR